MNNNWTKCEEKVPENDRSVLCRGSRGAVYIAKYCDGYYWNRPTIRGGDCDPVE